MDYTEAFSFILNLAAKYAKDAQLAANHATDARQRATDTARELKSMRMTWIQSGLLEGAKNEQQREATLTELAATSSAYQTVLHNQVVAEKNAALQQTEADHNIRMYELYRIQLLAHVPHAFTTNDS